MRAIVSGMLLGGLLSLCNIYSGLKIGWSNNMGVTASLLGFALWRGLSAGLGARPFSMLENNYLQMVASAAAAISSAGLVAPIPALTIITGRELAWPLLALWTFSVCLVGIAVAVGLRRQMIEVQKLPFPNGIATAETLREIYTATREAAARVWLLAGAAVVAAGVKLAEHLAKLPKWPLPGAYASGVTASGKVTAGNLTLAFEPSLLMVGIGGLVGLRAGISMLLGALLGYLVLSPIALEHGWVEPGAPDGLWFTQLSKWLLWPGVAMMVTSSLTSFAFSWRSIAASFKRSREPAGVDRGDVPAKWFLGGLIIALVFSVALQSSLFDIAIPIAALGVMMSFVLAVVAARVSGETNVTPVGAMGKVTQLMFGGLAPGQVAPNLMAANVTGGAASQCADLMHDLKAGWMLGAIARHQALAQVFGALAGALAGSAAYLLLIPDPQTQLITNEWPAPAVQTWKAVAEIFAKGFDAMPPFTPHAAIIGGIAGILLAITEKLVVPKWRILVPSASALGLALVLPAHNAIHLFFGAVIAALLAKYYKDWSERFSVVMFSGLIAGESLAGVGIAVQGMVSGT